MKKIFVIVVLFMGFSSCKKVLDTQPSDFVAPEYYFNTETQLNSALTAVYDCMQKGNMYSGGDGLGTVFNVTDEMYFAGNGTGPKVFNYTAGEPLVFSIWNACYTGIQRANLLLANINKPAMDETKRNNVKGQAKFLRAYFYFVLVQNFGAVPLKTEPTQSVVDVNIARTPASEVYDFIIQEMTEADTLVPPSSTYTYAERITQSAVEGILARVCLFKAGFPNNDASKYAEALKWAKKVMGNGLHQLNPNYAQVFINMVQDKYDVKESIWEVGYYTTGVGDAYTEYNPSLAVTLGNTQTNSAYPLVSGLYRIHPKLYNLFEKDPYLKDPQIPDKSFDLRRDQEIAPYRYGTGTNYTAPTRTYYTAAQIYDRQPNKLDRAYELTTNRFQSNTPINYCMLRYSDVLLMAAEAENEVNGPTQFAIDAVNAVRRRGYGKTLNGEGVKFITVTSGGSGYTIAPTVTISGGGGSGATATATVAGGKVTAIDINNHGTFYTSVPTISLTGGGGSGATTTSTLTLTTDADMKAADYASKDTFRKFIQDERARELAFEGWRRTDLIRWNILVPTLQGVANDAILANPATYRDWAAIAGNTVSTVFNYLPIPSNEISLNKSVTQNPGW